eukprot:1361598-Pyramimonas_sp.AAC.1
MPYPFDIRFNTVCKRLYADEGVMPQRPRKRVLIEVRNSRWRLCGHPNNLGSSTAGNVKYPISSRLCLSAGMDGWMGV